MDTPAFCTSQDRISAMGREGLEFFAYSSRLKADGLRMGAPALANWYAAQADACEAELARLE
jgi:hypothetical protein